MVDVSFVALRPGVNAPAPARVGDAGLDLIAVAAAHLPASGGRAIVSTGLAIALPQGYYGLVLPRSGLARRHGVTCLNTPGLIDAGYRGEIEVLLVNTDPSVAYDVSEGDRIAQLLVLGFDAVRFIQSESLPPSERGTAGWGHTGR